MINYGEIKMANINGTYPEIARVETGFWSMDRALSGTLGGNTHLGIPMTFVELSGFQGIGKSTLSQSLMAIVANHYQKKVAYIPFEHVDVKLMGSILDNLECEQEITLISSWEEVKLFFKELKPQEITDELLIDCLIQSVRRSDYCMGVVDSLSSIYTIAEAGSSVADRNMGRARVISNLARGVNQASRGREPYLTLLLSHKTAPMGGGTPTNTGAPTTGGEVKKNVSKVRIFIRRIQEPAFSMDSKKNLYEEQAYILEGKVEKNNFGREGKIFYVAMLGGKGAHIGLTAMYECKKIGICTFGKSVTLGGTKYGSIASILEKAHAREDEFFQPFIEALKNPSTVGKVVEDENDVSDSWEELPE
jgi:RecA/RadA recombinase